MSRPTIHVVTEFRRDSKVESYWHECFHDEDFHGYDVHVIDGTYIGHESYLYCDTFFKSVQLKFILDMVHRSKIKDGDIIVFANAWNFAAIPLSYFRDEFRWKIGIVGFWGDSLFNMDAPMWDRFHGNITKTFGRQMELVLYNAYDMNCFWSQRHWDLFRKKFSSLRGTKQNKWNDEVLSKAAVTGYPFGYLAKEAKFNPDMKQNVIMFPYNLRNDLSKNLLRGLKQEMTQFEFVFAQEAANDRLKYNTLLQDAKLMISTNRFDVNPVILYEGMLNGIVPLMPTRPFYEDVFPENYLYPDKLSFFSYGDFAGINLHRTRRQFERIIIAEMDNYNVKLAQVGKDVKALGKKYYSNGPFLEVLDELQDRLGSKKTRRYTARRLNKKKKFY